jgi:hypothetical protein
MKTLVMTRKWDDGRKTIGVSRKSDIEHGNRKGLDFGGGASFFRVLTVTAPHE